MINYALVGVGGFASTWIRSLSSLESRGETRIAAATEIQRDRYAEQLKSLAARGVRLYDSLEEMLSQERGRSQIVGLPVGIPAHAELAIQSLQAGYNVLVEKPAAPTIQQVHEMRSAAIKADKWCAVGYQWLYSPTIRWLRQVISSGQLGAVVEARGVTGWPRASAYYARNDWAGRISHNGRWVLDGPVTNATSHYLTNLLYLCAHQGDSADRIANVRAELYRAKPIESYDTAFLEIEMGSGTKVLYAASHSVAESTEPIMDIRCKRGSIHWEAATDTATVHYADGTQDSRSSAGSRSLQEAELSYVARVAAGQESAPLATIDEALPQVLALNLAFESSEGIRTVLGQHLTAHRDATGGELIAIRGTSELLTEVIKSGRSFSELGAPWASAGRNVEAQGYDRFPQSAALIKALGGPDPS